MPEIPNVVPGEPVESDWGNDVRDRIIQKFADATARDASLPFPLLGQVTWIDSPGQLDYWDGAAWVHMPGDAPSDGIPYGRQDGAWQQVVRKSGDTMTGELIAPSLIANTRLQGPLEVFSGDLAGVLAVSTVEQTIDSFVTPRQGRWLIQATILANYAALSEADQFSFRIREGGNQWAVAQQNMFVAWPAPGVTTGAVALNIQVATLLFAVGSSFDFTVQRFGATGGSNATQLNWSAFQIEDM